MAYENIGPVMEKLDDWWVSRSTAKKQSIDFQSGPHELGKHSLEYFVETFEKGIILKALETARGNQTRAASMLLTTKRVIQYKVRKYQIDYKKYRHDEGLEKEQLTVDTKMQ
jgi:transcriptional regulator with GAF, ATPase, and Fis domain